MKRFFSWLRRIVAFLLPREERFFDLFLEMLGPVRRSIEELGRITRMTSREVELAIEESEDRCDRLEAEIKARLQASITTPPQLTRDSILEIASTIDNGMDALKSAVKRLQAGEGEIVELISAGFPEFREMLDRLFEAADLSIQVMEEFSRNKIEATDRRLDRIHEIENEIDALHMKVVTERIYTSELSGKQFVILQVIGRIESAGDELQRLAKIIQGVLVSG